MAEAMFKTLTPLVQIRGQEQNATIGDLWPLTNFERRYLHDFVNLEPAAIDALSPSGKWTVRCLRLWPSCRKITERGRSSMAEQKLPKLTTGVRFSSPAPTYGAKFTGLPDGRSRNSPLYQ